MEPILASDESLEPHSRRAQFCTAWPWVLCVVGLDYLSSLAYTSSIAFTAAGRLTPLVTLLVVVVTLFLALPVYWYIAGRSPHGGGSTALLERAIPGWFGKFLVLVLLAFGAVDLVFTRTFSAADAAEHLIHNPQPAWQHLLNVATVEGETLRQQLPPNIRSRTDGLWKQQTVVTLAVLVLGAVAGLIYFKKGYTRNFVRLAVVTVGVYLALTLIVIVNGMLYLQANPQLVEQWWADVGTGNWKPNAAPKPMTGWRDILIACVPLFPYMALGLSGFELTLMAMPIIRGKANDDPGHPRGRIRNTRRLLVVAALLMACYLLASALVTTILIPPTAMVTDGQAKHRALAYLAHGGALNDGGTAATIHPAFGLAFGTIYDFSTISILALAGLSVAMTLSRWIPPYLQRLGMEFDWSVRFGVLVWLFVGVKLGVTVYYGADLDAQRGAYLTSVLAVFAFAAFVAAIDVWQKRRSKGWRKLFRTPLIFTLATLVFTASGLLIAVQRPGAMVLAGAFILLVLGISMVSRAWRCTELRHAGFEFADAETQQEWQKLCASDFPILVPIRPGGDTLQHKEIEVRTLHRIPATIPVMFLQAEIGDASNFAQKPLLRLTRENGRVLIHISNCVSIPHALAAAAIAIGSSGAVPEVHFGWSAENPVSANLHFVMFGHGNVPWLVYTLIRGSNVPEDRKPRVIVG